MADVGHCIQLYADFTQSGKNYQPFPDPASFQIWLPDLEEKDIRDWLRAIAEAARREIICPYKVAISVVTSAMVTSEQLRRGEVIINGDAVRAIQVANQIALQKAVAEYWTSPRFVGKSKWGSIGLARSGAYRGANGTKGISAGSFPLWMNCLSRVPSDSPASDRQSR